MLSKASAQVHVYRYLQDKSIDISISETNKLSIFIFVSDEASDKETENLLSVINTCDIDYDKFSIALIRIQPVAICPPDKKLILNSYDSLPSSFVLDPHYILIYDEGNIFNKVISARLNDFKGKLSQVYKKNGRLSPFYKIPDYKTFKQLIERENKDSIIQGQILSLQKELLYVKQEYENSKKPSRLQIGKYSKALSISMGIGSFLQGFKVGSAQSIQPKQGWEHLPGNIAISVYYKSFLTESVYMKYGVDFLKFKSDISVTDPGSLTISPSISQNQEFTVSPTYPIAQSLTRHFGVNIGTGYTFIDIYGKNRLNIDLTLSMGKAISSGNANFIIQRNDNTIIYPTNVDNYTNKYSLFLYTNPAIEHNISNNCSLQIGILGMIGVNKMNNSANYLLVNDNYKYVALEKSCDKINYKGIGITLAFNYLLK